MNAAKEFDSVRLDSIRSSSNRWRTSERRASKRGEQEQERSEREREREAKENSLARSFVRSTARWSKVHSFQLSQIRSLDIAVAQRAPHSCVRTSSRWTDKRTDERANRISLDREPNLHADRLSSRTRWLPIQVNRECVSVLCRASEIRARA